MGRQQSNLSVRQTLEKLGVSRPTLIVGKISIKLAGLRPLKISFPSPSLSGQNPDQASAYRLLKEHDPITSLG